ncbi:Nucleoside permease NupG [Salmonella enterica subsp. enterica]|nr:Nucleoside permease NupG [Salmonella enterica subsp. enterica]
MNLKLQLKILSFLQFCLWGSWLTTLGSYMFVTLKFDGASIGAVYSSLGIAAVFMPTLLGIVADKWLSAKWGLCPVSCRRRHHAIHGRGSHYAWGDVLCDPA